MGALVYFTPGVAAGSDAALQGEREFSSSDPRMPGRPTRRVVLIFMTGVPRGVPCPFGTGLRRGVQVPALWRPATRGPRFEDAPRRPFLDLQEAVAGRYSLEREIGRGGMGVVYLARDVTLDRPVAIKLLPPDQAARPGVPGSVSPGSPDRRPALPPQHRSDSCGRRHRHSGLLRHGLRGRLPPSVPGSRPAARCRPRKRAGCSATLPGRSDTRTSRASSTGT